jgi:hypothetical protein
MFQLDNGIAKDRIVMGRMGRLGAGHWSGNLNVEPVARFGRFQKGKSKFLVVM